MLANVDFNMEINVTFIYLDLKYILSLQYKHNGKARRGDGNDITPSPTKLLSIGTELKGLNRTINDLTPVSELPVNVRPRSRKEKNKLASRWVQEMVLKLK